MKIVIIDNYDSFTYNLAHLVKELDVQVDVLRNDQFRLEELERYDRIILSPGPGIPEEAGLLLDVIRTYAGKKPILGVCLGEQAIGQVFGGKLTNLSDVFHGVQNGIRIKNEDIRVERKDIRIESKGLRMESKGLIIENEGENQQITLEEDYIFQGLPEEILVGRYHSWVVDTQGFPDELAVTAVSAEGQVMALKHRKDDVRGIQFHPESVLTPDGKQIMKNWLQGDKNDAGQRA